MALYFDGGVSNNYAHTSYTLPAGVTELTCSMWINLEAAGHNQRMIDAPAAGGWYPIVIMLHNGSGDLRILCVDSTSALFGNVNFVNPLTYGADTFCALTVKTGGRLKGFMNDSKEYDVAFGANPIIAGTGQFDIGIHQGHASDQTLGKIWDVRVYTKELSETEIGILYHENGGDNITDNLQFRYLFDEKPHGANAVGANSLIDISLNSRTGTPVNTPVYREHTLKIGSIYG